MELFKKDRSKKICRDVFDDIGINCKVKNKRLSLNKKVILKENYFVMVKEKDDLEIGQTYIVDDDSNSLTIIIENDLPVEFQFNVSTSAYSQINYSDVYYLYRYKIL